MMKVRAGKLNGTLIVEPDLYRDERGAFVETWQERRYREAGLAFDFVQDMQSVTVGNTLRGLHYQIERPQGHLVTVLSGRIYDVGLDLRRNSSTFGKWMGLELDGSRRQQVWLPPGVAHGFYVLTDLAEIAYKCTDFYSAGDEGGVRWNDPDLGIEWPCSAPSIASRDAAFPILRDIGPNALPRV